MELLVVVFGVFSLASLVALVRFAGNPVFAFTLLLSLASLAWMVVLLRQASPARPKRGGRR